MDQHVFTLGVTLLLGFFVAEKDHTNSLDNIGRMDWACLVENDDFPSNEKKIVSKIIPTKTKSPSAPKLKQTNPIKSSLAKHHPSSGVTKKRTCSLRTKGIIWMKRPW